MSVPWYLMAKRKGGGGYKTASGPIVSVNDALAAPLRSLSIGIDPVQEGSGDPSPDNVRPISGWDSVTAWRTGKNLLDETARADAAQNVRYYYGIGALFKAGEYTLSASETASGIYVRKVDNTAIFTKYGSDFLTFTLTSDTLCYFDFYFANGASSSMTFQLEFGSTATSYSPYTGTTYPITIPVLGKNLLPNTPGRDSSGMLTYSVDPTTKKLVINGTASSTSYTGGGITKANARYKLKAGTYMLSVDQLHTNTATSYLNFEMFTSDGVRTQKIIYGNYDTKYVKFTITSDVVYDWWVSIAAGTYDNLQCGIQLELGSTATAYEPYINTVYGGTLDVLGGVLTVDRAMVDLGTLDWTPWGTVEGLYGAGISDMKAPATAEERKTDILCSMYPVAATATMNNNFTDKSCARYQQNVFVRDTSYATAAALTTALDGVSFVYPLATPITIPLTDTQISTLEGQNVMWADCGDIKNLEYAGKTVINPTALAMALAVRR